MRQGQEKTGLVALGCARGHRRQCASQLLRGGGEVARAKEVGPGAGRSRGKEWLEPALVERNRGAGSGGSGYLTRRLSSGSLFALPQFDGKGGVRQRKKR